MIKTRGLVLQVGIEERHDTGASVPSGFFVVSHPGIELPHDLDHYRQRLAGTLVVVDERVPGVGVLLHVVADPRGPKSVLEPSRSAAQGPVFASEAADDRARPPQEFGGISLLVRDAVVDA